MDELKYSKYIAITDLVDSSNRLIYSFLSGKMLLINDNTYKKVINNERDINSDTKKQFIEAGILTDAKVDELATILSENITTVKERNVFSFTIFPSSDCQLECHYCGQQHSKRKVDKKLYNDILKCITAGVAPFGKKHLAIGWFGAEPLLGLSVIDELTPQLKKIAERSGCSYSARITTNGLLLNRQNFQKLINNDVRDITISLDGAAKSHDQRRPTKGGGPTFNLIIKNLIDVLNYFDIDKEQIDIMLRINVDRYNCDDVIPLLELLGELNFQNKIKHFDIAPIHAWGNDAHLRSITPEEFADFKITCYLKLLELNFLDNISIAGRVKVVCQAVTFDSLYMQADGSLFDCSELPLIPAENETKKLGHIKNALEIKAFFKKPLK